MEKGAEYVGSSLTEALKQANEESKKTMGEKMTEMYQVRIGFFLMITFINPSINFPFEHL